MRAIKFKKSKVLRARTLLGVKLFSLTAGRTALQMSDGKGFAGTKFKSVEGSKAVGNDFRTRQAH